MLGLYLQIRNGLTFITLSDCVLDSAATAGVGHRESLVLNVRAILIDLGASLGDDKEAADSKSVMAEEY